MSDEPELSFYKEHPKTCHPEDFWGQVKRTVDGKPVSDEQIAMIVSAICDGLELTGDDVLLDLCCGNGALSDLIFSRCRGGVGVDFSEHLVQVAQRHFQRPPDRVYLLDDVEHYVATATGTERFTKALCYGSFMFLPERKARTLLAGLRERLASVSRLFIGNLPDKALMEQFFAGKERPSGVESDPGSPIGIWRTEGELSALANETGWRTRFCRMPRNFYGAHYRFDAVLVPLDGAE